MCQGEKNGCTLHGVIVFALLVVELAGDGDGDKLCLALLSFPSYLTIIYSFPPSCDLFPFLLHSQHLLVAMASLCIPKSSSFVTTALLLFSFFVTTCLSGNTVEQECTQALTALLPCLGFVQGSTRVPSKDCCTPLAQVQKDHPKCLCELMASGANQSSDSGLPMINPTLALKLPVACSVSANPEICPGLLGISPTSPEAQIFETQNATSPGSSEGEAAASSKSKKKIANRGSLLFPAIWLLEFLVLLSLPIMGLII